MMENDGKSIVNDGDNIKEETQESKEVSKTEDLNECLENKTGVDITNEDNVNYVIDHVADLMKLDHKTEDEKNTQELETEESSENVDDNNSKLDSELVIKSSCTTVAVSNTNEENEGVVSSEENDKEILEAYINELEQRSEVKTKLREKNRAPQRPDDVALGQLDSSLKKNSAFVRKLRNFTATQLKGLIKDMSTLNLSKYNSEVASAIVEAKLKLSDVSAAVTLCSEMHIRYAEFSKLLLDYWIKTLSLKKDEKVSNPSKLRVDLRFYGDLITSGIFPYKEALPVLGNVLTVLTTSDKEEHTNLNIIISFCKHCGEDYAGLLPRTIRILSEKYNVQTSRNSVLSPEKQKNVRCLLKDYYNSLCKHLLKEHSEIQAFERQNRKILQTRGELSTERKEKREALVLSFQKLHNATISFAEILDEDVPVLPEESLTSRTNTYDDELGTFREGSKTDLLTMGGFDIEDAIGSIDFWEDEETQQFYTEFPILTDYLPNFNVVKSEQIAEPVMTEDKLDEDLKEEELDDYKKEEELVSETCEDIEEVESNTNISNKILLDSFLSLLPTCVNKEMIDSAAVEFLLNHNTKHNRKKLVKTLFIVSRTRLDLLPFYARMVAVLNPMLPDVAADLSSLLKNDFRYHIRKKDQINIESKIKVIRFISELVKFGLYSKLEGLYCLKILLHDFSHHHIEMACTMMETCGRFFFRSPDTHQRTKVYLEQMMRMKTGKALDSRYAIMIENAYYFVNPPESPVSRVKEQPVLYDFIQQILYQDLTKSTESTKVLEFMRRLEWKDQQTSDFAIMCLTQAWNVPYPNIKDLANLLAGLVDYQEFVAAHVVDGVLEDIRIGLEINTNNLNQRRIAMVKYLGELYNYRMVESNDVFKILYSLIAFGVASDHEYPSPFDPADQLFRIRLVCTLLETCGQYFSHGPSKSKLEYFFVYFQHYYWFKRSDPIWTTDSPFPTSISYLFKDTLTTLRPGIKLCESYQEAKDSLEEVTLKMRDKLAPSVSNQQIDYDGLDTILESLENEDDEDEDQGGNYDGSGISDEEESEDENDSLFPDATIIDREIENRSTNWSAEDYLDMDSDNDLSDNQNFKSLEDDDFVSAFDKMVSDNMQERLKDNVKPQQVDIPVPLHVKSNAKKTYEQLQEPEVEVKDTVNFLLMVRKGNKQQYKNVAVPTNSELALNLRSQEKAERVEKEKVKKLTLYINDRLEEEDYQDQISQIQKPTMINLNRERKNKYQHPKGAPDADLIFGRKKIQRFI